MARDVFQPLVTDVEISGLDQLVAELDAIDERVTDKALQRATVRSTRLILQTMRGKLKPGHGFETGLLANSLGTKTKFYRKTRVAFGVVGPRRFFGVRKTVSARLEQVRRSLKSAELPIPTKYAHLVEYGTAPHRQPRRGSMHPGAQPRPFIRNTMDEVQDQIRDIVNQEIGNALVNRGS